MADYEYDLTQLSFAVSHAHVGDTITVVVKLTKAGETHKATLPAMPRDEIRGFLARINAALDRDEVSTDLIGGDTFTVELIE